VYVTFQINKYYDGVMEVYFYLDANKKVKNPNRTIYCYVRDGRDNVIVINTKEKVNPKHWNKTTYRAITTGPDL